MLLSNAQAQIASDLHRFRVVNCGRRFGKTTLAIDQIKACAVYKNDARIAYIAPTFQQARDIAWAQLRKDFSKSGAVFNEARLEIRIKNVHGTESLIVLRGWESIETLRGQLFDLIVIDEVASMRNFWSSWEEVVRPTLTDRKGEVLFISTPRGFNHFYDLYNLQEGDPDFKSFHFTSYDNPNIPAEEIDKAKSQLTEDRFAQEYLADFRKMEGLVYKEFDREKHVVSLEVADSNQWMEKIVGLDYGFTNPAAALTICRTSSDEYFITDELYERGKTDMDVNEYVAALGAQRIYPDPAAASAIADLKKRVNTVREVIKGADSIKNGIDKVRELLKAGKLKVCSNCVNVISEFETYSYPDKKPNHNEYEDPIKENDHAMDALRYAIMMVTSRNRTHASTFYPQSSQPNPQQLGLPPELRGKTRDDHTAPEVKVIPKYATTYIPHGR